MPPVAQINKAQSLFALELVERRLVAAKTLEDVIAITREAARKLCGADGATFILREGDLCHYADENAIAPLWKGRRFPMRSCISGWSMIHGQAVVIPDIYADDRIPHDAYRPTFVKSLVMVPICENAPVGAIGNYWAEFYDAPDECVELLQLLANFAGNALAIVGR